MGDPRDLYRSLVMEHARNPRNHGPLVGATHEATGYNPLCGDKVVVRLRLSESGAVDEVAFEGQGCAIAMAAASTLTEAVAGLSGGEAIALKEAFLGQVDSGQARQDLGELAFFAIMGEFPSRKKCATLPWTALAAAITGDAATVSTE